jgi:hypothetical protein
MYRTLPQVVFAFFLINVTPSIFLVIFIKWFIDLKVLSNGKGGGGGVISTDLKKLFKGARPFKQKKTF